MWRGLDPLTRRPPNCYCSQCMISSKWKGKPLPEFIPGLELNRLYFDEVVKPLLESRFPELCYSAGLMGEGSDVLGFDDEMSRDHNWGPMVDLFLTEEDHAQHAKEIDQTLRDRLPLKFRGYSTSFSDGVVYTREEKSSGPVNHRVGILTIKRFFLWYLGYDLDDPIAAADWLTFPEHKLLTITRGGVFHDPLDLSDVRHRFRYYPQDVWLYLLACAWALIEEEEALMGRAGAVGDEVGSAIIASRLVRDLMGLCFLMERRYAPYAKWFGTAFNQLACANDLMPYLQGVVSAETWEQREEHFVGAYERIAAIHNALGLTKPIPQEPIALHRRPFKVIAPQGFQREILRQIKDKDVKRIASRPWLIGGIDQLRGNTEIISFSMSAYLTSYPRWRRKLRRLYQ